MKICITNDDGIRGEGLQRLVQWAKKLGEVTVYAPKVEQSAKSHAIEIHKPFEVKVDQVPGAARAYAVDSTPADCVRFALLGAHEEFDLIISGVNRGLNIGQDIMYSGTVSAAFEASALGSKALALSTEPGSFDEAIAHLDAIWDFITSNDLYSKSAIWNVNIPHGTTGELRITRQGGPYFSDEFRLEQPDLYMPLGKDVFKPTENSNFDTDCVLRDRCISLTPLTIDRTDWRAFENCK